MSIVPAICPECGKAIKTDDNKRADICKHCGEAFIVADAIAAASAPMQPSVADDKVNFSSALPKKAETAPLSDVPQDERKFWLVEGTLLIKYNGKKRSVRIPDGITELAAGCITADEVTVPPSVKLINAGAIYAQKIIIESNPDIVLSRAPAGKCEVVFEGEFGAILDEWRECGSSFATVRFAALDEKAALKKQPDLYEHTADAVVVFKGETEIRSTQWKPDYTSIYYTLDKYGKATILRYRFVTYSNVLIVDKDFRNIDGHVIKAFRSKNIQKQFFDFLRYTTVCGTHIAPAVMANLPLGLTYLPRDLQLIADNIMLPATIEVIEPFAVCGWTNAKFYGEMFNITYVRRIEENGFYMGSSAKTLKYHTVYIRNEPDFVHESVCKFVEYDGFETIDLGGGLGTAMQKYIYLGKTKTYKIELDPRCGELKAVATRAVPLKTYKINLSPKVKKYTEQFPADCSATVQDEKGKIIGMLKPAPATNIIKKTMLGYKIIND